MKPSVLVLAEEGEAGRIRDALRWHGYAVVTTSSAAEAFEKIAVGGLAVLVLDEALLGMDAERLLQRLGGSDTVDRPHFLLLTSAKVRRGRLTGHALGGDAYFDKPVAPAEVVTVVDHLFKALAEGQDHGAGLSFLLR